MVPIALAIQLASFVPSVLKLITGSDKAEAAAAAVVEVAKQVTGQADGDAALQALHADPVLVLQFQRDMAAQQVELERIYLGDRADARARDVKMIERGIVNRRATYMVWLTFAAVFVIAGLLVFVADPTSPAGAYLISVGTLFAGKFGTAFDFEFGSSRGSRDKDAERRAGE